MACQLGYKQPFQSFLLASAENEGKMPNPAGQGRAEAGAEAIQSGWEEVDPGLLR